MSKGLVVIRSRGSIKVKGKVRVIVGSPGGGEVVVVGIGLRIVRGGGLVRTEVMAAAMLYYCELSNETKHSWKPFFVDGRRVVGVLLS